MAANNNDAKTEPTDDRVGVVGPNKKPARRWRLYSASLGYLAAALLIGLAGFPADSAAQVRSRVDIVDSQTGAAVSLGTWSSLASVTAGWGTDGPRVAVQRPGRQGEIISFSVGNGIAEASSVPIPANRTAILAAHADTFVLLQGGRRANAEIVLPSGARRVITLCGSAKSGVQGWLSSDGRWLAVDVGDFPGPSHLTFVNIRTGRRVDTPSIKGAVLEVVFSSNDQLAAVVPDPQGFSDARTLKEVTVSTGRSRTLVSLPGTDAFDPHPRLHWINSPQFLPDSTEVAYVRDFNQLTFLPTNGLSFEPPDPACNAITAVAISPTGSNLALTYASDERRPSVLEVTPVTGQPQDLHDLGAGNVTSLSFSPDGGQVLAAITGLSAEADRGPVPSCPKSTGNAVHASAISNPAGSMTSAQRGPGT